MTTQNITDKVDTALAIIENAVKGGMTLTAEQESSWDKAVSLQMDDRHHLALVEANRLVASLPIDA